MNRITLILDADDTLWENNIFYEGATDAFAERMAGEGFDPVEARQTFEHIEHERVPLVGYAPQEFARSMAIAYQRLCQQHGRTARSEVTAEVEAIGRQVLNYPITLLEGVAETLAHLHRRCRLILLTKGDPQTQQDKVDRSGLAPYFETVHVVPEKGPEVLRDLVARHGLNPEQTWMVGNSPRSDVNPALEAGIGAIYIPYAAPWTYEEVPIADPDRVITLRRFPDLLDFFPKLEGN
ncbi:MAG TPA: HAD family hydrolase [Anaerolineae bacterium]|nr:HAD family hydrolase [Anaerolineae bacterium]